MQPLPDQASGNLDAAIHKYKMLVADVLDGRVALRNESAAAVSQLACEAYAEANDWSGMEEFVSISKVISFPQLIHCISK